jgi:hypothetical protein
MPVPQGDNHEFRPSTPSTKERQVKPSTHLFHDFSATEEWCVWDGLRAIPCAPQKGRQCRILGSRENDISRQAQVVLWSNSSSSRPGTGLCCVTRGFLCPYCIMGGKTTAPCHFRNIKTFFFYHTTFTLTYFELPVQANIIIEFPLRLLFPSPIYSEH